jgi:hypothetical protein
MQFFDSRRTRLRFFDMGVNVVLLGFAVGFFAYEFWRWRLVRMAQYFSGQFDRQGTGRLALSWCRRLFVAVAVIVIFQIFKNVADIQEGVAVQADIHECRLHAWQNAGNSAFVDATDECEFFFALDVDFY